MLRYIIDNNNKQENCSQIPENTRELEISCDNFKSTAGIKGAPNLEKITFIKCQQKINMDEVEQCVNVQEVCVVKSLIAKMQGLDKLNCRICADLSGSDFNTDHIPPNVTVLKLSSCRLTKIPNIVAFSKLVEVRFGEKLGPGQNKNKFDVVDQDSFPKALQVLDLSNCGLVQQPDLHSLDSLVELDLSFNQKIQTILSEKIPKKLKKLNVCECGLQEQPDLHSLDSVVEINLNSNEQIHKIEAGKLPQQLQKLNSRCNYFAPQPDLHALDQLVELDLYQNIQIQKICSEKIPRQLQKLNLGDCRLLELPDVHLLDQLVELALNHNTQMQKIYSERLPKQLQKLILTNCDLVKHPNLHSLNSLLELNLAGNNQLQKIQHNSLPTNIQVLNLSGTGICSLLQLYNNTKIKELDVSGCNLSDINQLQVLKLMPELEKFICYGNDICKNETIKDTPIGNFNNVCDYKSIVEALALVLTPSIQEVCIVQYIRNIVDEVHQKQTDLKNVRNPFAKTLDGMLDEQFYEEHKEEISQLQTNICTMHSENELIFKKIKQLAVMREEVEGENCLILCVLE